MLFSHIQYFLNPEGMTLFPSWYAELKQLFSKQAGFISIRYAFDPHDITCIHIWTDFDSEENAEKWAQSQLKIDIQSRLDPFRMQPMLVKRYELIDY